MTSRRSFNRGLVAAAAAGLSPLSLAQQARTGGTLVYAGGVDAQTLDPQFITDIPTFRVCGAMYEALTAQDADGKVGPGLAASWTVSDDKRTWTFKLRPNVRFHDGTPFNAEAVKFTFDRLLDPATGSPRKSALAAVQSMAVVDDLAFSLTTKEPFAPVVGHLWAYKLYILPPTQVN